MIVNANVIQQTGVGFVVLILSRHQQMRGGSAQRNGIGRLGCKHAVDVPAFLSGRGVGVDVGHAKGVNFGAPGEGRLREILGDLLD